ncbi:MAG: hypothetical protein JOZ41_13805 [Chloroflexi bacterium]|nr:hypothetical protein [Chloroflexota bacterium]
MALDARGDLAVTDTGSDRIQRFSSQVDPRVNGTQVRGFMASGCQWRPR